MSGRTGAARRDDGDQHADAEQHARGERRLEDDEAQEREEEQHEAPHAAMQQHAMQREVAAAAPQQPEEAATAAPDAVAPTTGEQEQPALQRDAAEPPASESAAPESAAPETPALAAEGSDGKAPKDVPAEIAEQLHEGTLGDGDVGAVPVAQEDARGGDEGSPADAGGARDAAPATIAASGAEVGNARDGAAADAAGPQIAEVADALPAPPPPPAARARPSASSAHDVSAEIDAAMASERAQIGQQFTSQRAAVETTVAAQEAMLLGVGIGKLAATLGDLSQRETVARSMFDIVRGNVRTTATTQAALAQGEADTARQRIRDDATRQQEAATQSADAEGKRMTQSGKAAGRKIISSGNRTRAAVGAAVQQSIGTAELIDDAGDRAAVTTALNKVRSSTRDQLLDQGLGDHDRLLALGQKNHQDLLAQAGTLFRDRNQDLPELLQGISDTGRALGGRFKLMMYTQLVAVDRAEREYLAELRRIKSTAGEIVVAGQVAGRKVRQRGQLQVATLRAREVGATARIDGLGSEAHAELDQHEVLPRDQAARFGKAVAGQMGEARGTILTQAAAEGDAELGMLAGTSERFGGIVDGKRGELGSQIDGALAQTIATFGESTAGMASQCAVDRSLALAMYATTFATFSAGSWAKLDEARADWKQQADGFDATVNTRAEASVAKHAQLVEAMPAKLDGVSKSTITERHKSRLRRTLEGAWSGFKSFVIWAVVAIVVIGLAVVATVPLAVALAIAAAVAFGIAIYHRFSALFEVWGDWSWQDKAKGVVQTLFASVGDLIGVTGMLEGLFGKEAVTGRELSPEEAAERFTVGALTLLTLGLIRAFRGKAAGAGRQPAGELPPGEAPPGEAPVGGEAPTTKPPAVETPRVEPRSGEPPAVEPTATEPPTTELPTQEPSIAETPATETPATDGPAPELPVTDTPTTEPPVTEGQTDIPAATKAQGADGSAKEPPATEGPVKEPQSTDRPLEHPQLKPGDPLPNYENAMIDRAKFDRYSMDPANKGSNGKWKAFKQIGYEVEEPAARAASADSVMGQLRAQLGSQAATPTRATTFGQRFEVRITLEGPTGGGTLVTQWQMENGVPRLITNWLEVHL